MAMELQSGNFELLPSKEEIVRLVEQQRQHCEDITSYMWYIIPIANRFGDKVYEVAVESLKNSFPEITAAQLRELAEDMTRPDSMERYADNLLLHYTIVTG